MLHYIITRFNLQLWTHDKKGQAIDREQWLERRLDLFERYCFPSLCAQTCQDFKWFLLFDNKTPEKYKERVTSYKDRCPQIQLIAIQPTSALQLISIIQDVVKDFTKEHLKLHPDEETLITTYLDNDDALRSDFVEIVQEYAAKLKPRTFISFINGIQYFTELQIATRIRYKNNHFISFIEEINAFNPLMTVYGFGSHFYIERIKNCEIKYIDSEPMWVEVVHEENVDNDVKMTLHTKLIKKKEDLSPFCGQFHISRHSKRIYITKFAWRRVKQLMRRGKDKLFGRKDL